MKHIIILASILAAVLVCGCHDVQEPEPDMDGYITFGDAQTKAFIGSEELKTSGMEVKVWDFMDDATTPYIDDIIVSDGTDIWNYKSGNSYKWTFTGIHNFFGYLLKDVSSGITLEPTAPFIPSMDMTTRTLSIPATTLTTGSPQLDFLYTGNITRDASDATQKGLVKLDMKHLFTAFAITLENASFDLPVTLHWARIEFPNRSAVTIPYMGAGQDLTAMTGLSLDPATYWFDTERNGSDIYIAEGVKNATTGVITPTRIDLLSGTLLPNTQDVPEFYFSWPLKADEIAPTNPIVDEEGNPVLDADGFPTYDDNDSKIVLNYTVGGTTKTTRVKFTPMDYIAGKRYLLNLSFVDKQIILNYEVLPWDYNQHTISFEEDVVTAEPMTFVDDTYFSCTEKTDKDGSKYWEVLVKADASTVQAKFKITTPVGGTLQIGAVGDVSFFDVSPKTVQINPDINGGEVLLNIRPKTELAPERTKDSEISFNFSVSTQWKDIDATEMICGENIKYKIVWIK